MRILILAALVGLGAANVAHAQEAAAPAAKEAPAKVASQEAMEAAGQAERAKAEAREKQRDLKMRRLSRSICSGC